MSRSLPHRNESTSSLSPGLMNLSSAVKWIYGSGAKPT